MARRSSNGMGVKVLRELQPWEGLREVFEQHGNDTEALETLETFVDDGEWLYENLQALMHKEPVDRGFSNRKITKWLWHSQKSRAKLGLARGDG